MSERTYDLIKEAKQLASEYPDLMAMENGGDNPLFEIMGRVGFNHLTFCCLDCDGGYSWSTLSDDLENLRVREEA